MRGRGKEDVWEGGGLGGEQGARGLVGQVRCAAVRGGVFACLVLFVLLRVGGSVRARARARGGGWGGNSRLERAHYGTVVWLGRDDRVLRVAARLCGKQRLAKEDRQIPW